MLALSTHSANEGSSWDLLVNLSFSPPLPSFPPLFLSLLLFGVSRGEADKGNISGRDAEEWEREVPPSHIQHMQ